MPTDLSKIIIFVTMDAKNMKNNFIEVNYYSLHSIAMERSLKFSHPPTGSF